VFATHEGTVRDHDVVIKVSKPNLYPPVFQNKAYEFVAYRNSVDSKIPLVVIGLWFLENEVLGIGGVGCLELLQALSCCLIISYYR
jgi:hypothetical protein